MLVRKSGLLARLEISLVYIFLLFMMIATVFPIVWNIATSFKAEIDTIAYPPKVLFKPTIKAYSTLLSYSKYSGIYFWYYASGSVVVGLLTMIGTLIFSYPAAYSIARFQFRGRRKILFILIGTRMLPPLAMMVPLYLFITRIGLFDTYLGLTLTYLSISLPFSTWLLIGFIQNIPIEIEEAAFVDGCSKIQTLIKIVIPLTAPGLFVTGFLAFLLAWNDFVLASVLTMDNTRTLTILGYMFISSWEDGSLIAQMAATASLLLIPPILFVVLCQRYLAQGLGLGAIK